MKTLRVLAIALLVYIPSAAAQNLTPQSISFGPLSNQLFGPAGSWAYNNNVLGEHAIIQGGKIYAPISDWTGTFSGSGIAVLDPATGAVLSSYTHMPSAASQCVEAAPAIDIRGNINIWSCTEVSGLTQIDPNTGAVLASLHVPNAVDWEAVPYDPVIDLILYSSGSSGFSGLRAVHATDYSTAWTNTDGAPAAGSYETAPPLILGGFVYYKDYRGDILKIDMTTGLTVAMTHATAVSDGNETYAQMTWDSAHARLLVTGNDNVAFALNASDLSVIWSKAVPDTGFYFFRGGAYNPGTGIWYVTARETTSPYRSKVYALDTQNAGNILWTNTTAYDNNAEISSMLVDDSYVYSGTYDYINDQYSKYLVLNASDGTLNESFALLNGVSSGQPTVWNGKFILGLWTTFGYQALQIRNAGATGDFYFKADRYMTGYVGQFSSGNLLSQAPAPPALVATATSGLPVTFTSNSPAVCTVYGAAVTLGSSGVCSITASQAGNANYMTAAPVTQTFLVTPVPASTLTVTVAPAGLGSVAFGSQTCVSACSGSFAGGTILSLTATPLPNYTFSGWSGACSGAGTCTVTLNASQAVTANFASLINTSLTAALGTKSGATASRIWPVVFTGTGPGTAANIVINSFTLTQTTGAACTPSVLTAMPLSAGSIVGTGSVTANVTIGFTGCSSAARFRLTMSCAANGGAIANTVTISNQFQ